MSNIPKNTKLWDMCVMQAKAKFAKWPSAAASAWVRNQYMQKGGQFVGSVHDMSRDEKRDYDESERKKAQDVSRNDRSIKKPAKTDF